MATDTSQARLHGHPLDPAIIEAVPGLFARAFRAQGLSHYTPEQIEAGLNSAAGGSSSYDLFRTGSGLVAMIGGRPVACGALGSADVFDAHGTPGTAGAPKNVATIRAFCTDPDFAGRGLGRLIMDGLLTMARERGVRELRLTATLSAVGFYERCGFAAGEPFPVPGAGDMRVLAMPMRMSLAEGGETPPPPQGAE